MSFCQQFGRGMKHRQNASQPRPLDAGLLLHSCLPFTSYFASNNGTVVFHVFYSIVLPPVYKLLCWSESGALLKGLSGAIDKLVPRYWIRGTHFVSSTQPYARS